MSGFFPTRDASGDAWFRLGRLEVTSVLAVVLLGAIGMLAGIFVRGLPEVLAYAPELAFRGQVWRFVTWPLADQLGFWSVLNLVLLWYFGRELEAQIGRRRMAGLLGGIWLSLTVATTVIALLSQGAALAGLGFVEFCILLLWIAEYPTRRFIFNIPAWVLGAFFVGLQVLTFVGARAWGGLLSLLLSLALVALAAKRSGLLSAYRWIPGRPAAERGPRAPRPSAAQQRESRRRESDEERMDALLGKISAEGLHSLTKAERAELEKLRQRRRR